jgi:hypothetical protein
MFANSTAETSTDTEKAFGKAFAAQFGNIALIVLLVVGAAFVTILMIVGNTMALSIRERTREIGVLKTLGFSGPRILAMVLGESVLLALLGGVPGLAIAALVAAALRNNLANVAPAFAVSPTIILQGLALMIALGLITGIIPALSPCGLKLQPRSDGDRHAFALASGRGGYRHQSQEHRAAALAFTLDGDRDRAGGDRPARLPGDGQRLPAHHRGIRRR